jgi:hypothetical protein
MPGESEMVVATYEARIVNGRLEPGDWLKQFEGQRVRVTVAPVHEKAERSTNEATSEPEPPEDLDVEKDVYVKMPFRSEIVQDAVIVDGGSLQPCLIFPEEMPDD